MNRKQFLRRSALMSLAAMALPRIGYAFQDEKKEESWYFSDMIKRNEGSYLRYSLHINDKEAAEGSAEAAHLELTITDYPTDTGTGGTKGVYHLERTGDVKTEGYTTVIKYKNAGEVTGQDVLKGVLPKKISMKLMPKQSVELDMGKGKSVTLNFHVPSDDDTDNCFLTTACTIARGLPDDCMELTTLRELRDGHMRPTADGAELVTSYYSIAPQIVRKVNALDNRADVWRLVYDDLVMPAVELIREGRKEEAVRYYAAYVGWMQEAFLAT